MVLIARTVTCVTRTGIARRASTEAVPVMRAGPGKSAASATRDTSAKRVNPVPTAPMGPALLETACVMPGGLAIYATSVPVASTGQAVNIRVVTVMFMAPAQKGQQEAASAVHSGQGLPVASARTTGAGTTVMLALRIITAQAVNILAMNATHTAPATRD